MHCFINVNIQASEKEASIILKMATLCKADESKRFNVAGAVGFLNSMKVDFRTSYGSACAANIDIVLRLDKPLTFSDIEVV